MHYKSKFFFKETFLFLKKILSLAITCDFVVKVYLNNG